MNKKGMLLAEETLKIVIAVISIGFLILLLTSLYYRTTGGEKEKQAEESLERIVAVINNVQNNYEEVFDIGPPGWYIFTFVGDEKKPNSCLNKDCLCICDTSWLKNDCDDKGVCNAVGNLNDFGKIKIGKTPFVIFVDKSSGVTIGVK